MKAPRLDPIRLDRSFDKSSLSGVRKSLKTSINTSTHNTRYDGMEKLSQVRTRCKEFLEKENGRRIAKVNGLLCQKLMKIKMGSKNYNRLE